MLVLIAIAILAGWLGFVYLFPAKTCERGPCSRCGGTGTRFRFGARLVRRGILRSQQAVRDQRAGRDWTAPHRRRGPHGW